MPPENDSNAPKRTVVGEHYVLVEKLGEGAFGQVFRAHHELLGQDFAVKLLKPELCEDQDIRDRFLDEARALIRFSHPNVVQLRHVGQHEGRLFLVMDFVEGVELSALIKDGGPIPEKRALNLIRQILAGLEAAHAAGIVHRDLKPSNILVEKRADGTEHAKILDFGLSKFSAIDGPAGAHRSVTGTIVGTLAYMSPEQIKGDRDIDGRSDLFAAGLILQEMLQGHHPYPGESGIVVAAKLLRDPIPPIDEDKRKSISTSTMTALGRALERDRDARFPSVTAFSQSLDGRGPPSDTSRVATVLEAQQELARQEAEAAAKAGGQRAGAGGRKRSPLPLVLALVVIAGGAAAFFVFGQGSQGQDGPAVHTAGGGTPPAKDHPAPVQPGIPAKGGVTPSQPEVPAKGDPTPSQPGIPAKGDPTSSQPEVPAKGDPTPSQPEIPAKGDPTSSQPEIPAKGDPTSSQPEIPAKGDPAPSQPEIPAKGDPAPSQPTSPDAALSPQDCCGQAGPLFQSGSWGKARALFMQAAAQSDLTDDVQVAALRGAAESWIHEADQLARSGKVDAALATLAQAIAWLQDRHAAYERVEQAVERARLQLGFSRMHEAEAHVERARWLGVQGKSKEAEAELTAAATAYDFALQQLQRDGVRYWELLIRRAEMFRLKNDSTDMIADVAHTTKTNNTEVPAHMWVAHATAARRVAQAWARRGNASEAQQWAAKAAKVAEDGVGWQDVNLTRRQWLDMARVLFVQASLMPATEDPTALNGKMSYWIGEAAKTPPAPWVDPDVSKAELLVGEAMEGYLAAKVQRARGDADAATKALDQADAQVTEALRLRSEVQARGGELLDALPYEVQAALLQARGDSNGASGALAAAAKAAAVNPD